MRPHSGSIKPEGACEQVRYFSRFHTVSILPPMEAVGTVHLISSRLKLEMGRDCTVPVQLGKTEPSMLNVTTLSFSDQVPNEALLPWTMAAFSSGVPLNLLPEANFGKSLRRTICEN